jgi:NADH-quinone oxidoreductase subunit C
MELNLSPALQKVADDLTENFPDHISDFYQSSGDTFVRISADSVINICTQLKDEHRFLILTDVIGTDRYTSEDRFEVIYNLISLRDRERLFVKVWLPEENPEVESVTRIWKSANWLEREVYDMFGIRFLNHPDHRRIYMPEDFQYFPLRKEFPLLGIPGSIEMPNTTPDKE